MMKKAHILFLFMFILGCSLQKKKTNSTFDFKKMEGEWAAACMGEIGSEFLDCPMESKNDLFEFETDLKGVRHYGIEQYRQSVKFEIIEADKIATLVFYHDHETEKGKIVKLDDRLLVVEFPDKNTVMQWRKAK